MAAKSSGRRLLSLAGLCLAVAGGRRLLGGGLALLAATSPPGQQPSGEAVRDGAAGQVKLATVQGVLGAVAAAVLVSRIRDVQHLQRLILEKGSPAKTLEAWIAALAIYAYERATATVLHSMGLGRVPSTLAAMLSLFAVLLVAREFCGRGTSDRLAALLRPGVDLLGKWMGLFLAPPLASLDASIMALPAYGLGVWATTVALLGCGWAATHTMAAVVATRLAPRRPGDSQPASPTAAPRSAQAGEVSQEEAVRRAWVVLAAGSCLGVACAPLLPGATHRPLGMLCELSATVAAFALARLLPDRVQRVLHPLVLCALASNLSARYVGPVAPFFDGGAGVGDRLFQWLAAAVTGLGVRMYATADKWLDDAADLRCVLATCGAAGCFSLLGTAALALLPLSPLGLPAPLALPLLHRSVMSALGIEGSLAVGPESDPKLAVASILITGCVGASLGGALLGAFPKLFNTRSPLVRGISMGCSAHSIGTAGLIAEGDTDAAAIAGAAMCLSGTVHTLVLQLPGVVPAIRALAGLPMLC